VREINPGEVVRLEENGVTTWQAVPPAKPALCVFEYIYFARPDSLLEGRPVHRIRRHLGERLAWEQPAEGDMVIGVPDSATAHAIGYAHASGIPFGEGLIKNRYIGRTFIQPDDRLRRLGVALKFNPLPVSLKGKRIVLVDDSIVRGTTSGPIVRLLRDAGAAEVHMRVAAPPIRYPCFMGVDMATQEELIAHGRSVADIARYVEVDSLGYLSLEGLLAVVGQGNGRHCLACFTGDYPVPALAGTGKEMFEPVPGF
jgi:amidophosphoribosyltransferase